MINLPDPEIGRELSAHDLVVKTVVVLFREDRSYAYTVWVVGFDKDHVVFGAGEVQTFLLVKRHPDGKMEDETGQRIRVFEYLGVV
jgi:hypothetical protein